MALRGVGPREVGVRGAAVAVLAVGTLACCGTGHRLAPVLQTESGVAAFTLDNAALYVVGVPETGTVTAYRLHDGRQSWRVPDIPGAAGLTSTTAVLSGYPARCADDEDLTFTMLDASSGAARWRHAGTPVAVSADGARYLLRERATPPGCTGGTDMRAPDTDDSPAAGDPAAGDPADDRLVALDTITGTAAWTRPLDPLTVAVPVAAGSRSPAGKVTVSGLATVSGLVTLSTDGTLQSLDLATGAPRATTKLAAATTKLAAPPTGSPPVRLVTAGRMLILAAPLAGASAVGLSGYDPLTLAPQWTVQVPLPAAAVVYQPCGNLLCAEGPDSTVAVDPATGAMRWRLDGLVRQAGRRIAVATQVPATDSTRLIDVATGRVTRTLAHSVVVGAAAPAARLVLSRMDGNRTTFSVLDLDTAALREVGDATGRYDSCQAGTGYLACRATESAAINLWRIG